MKAFTQLKLDPQESITHSIAISAKYDYGVDSPAVILQTTSQVLSE